MRLSNVSRISQLFILAGSEVNAEVARPAMYASSLCARVSSDVILRQTGVIERVASEWAAAWSRDCMLRKGGM
jgi:hypothetical protein